MSDGRSVKSFKEKSNSEKSNISNAHFRMLFGGKKLSIFKLCFLHTRLFCPLSYKTVSKSDIIIFRKFC
jgi:hypothetical protein